MPASESSSSAAFASEHREAAEQIGQQADAAEQRVRIAEQEAARQRAEAQAQQERAELHEHGLADDELIKDDERDRFRGTSAVPENEGEETPAEDAEAQPEQTR